MLDKRFVPVNRISLDHHQIAGQNVAYQANVHQIELALIIDALTHVQIHAALVLSVTQAITIQFALVHLHTLVIRFNNVRGSVSHSNELIENVLG